MTMKTQLAGSKPGILSVITFAVDPDVSLKSITPFQIT
ncbi:hypothetical protein ALQ93_102568 [Pseudomonas syringae pv. pisi]|uniref:Uncharacterized protein n=1 Tax=Pseudomonas syringae pv. tagetis TaxID=129140 RepID=A0A0Q0CB37_9PSED|nr:hypothetical protein ALO44_102100 [Pseudomonas syringae pv. tagetis]RML58338.1 hypothetical protein ALQ93_102568 [Pseudomonas syringae pv. pisi]RMW13770.1 hypothetical protein ALO98_101741 [Pseudomonas syringae pv. tagetis]RMW23604.1 hypothetical protein ALO97_101965 [Pseudomonas syringae pv. tagetis]